MQCGECKPDSVATPPVRVRLVNAVHLLTHIIGDRGVQALLRCAELVLDGEREPFREQAGALERVELFLHEPAHQVGHVNLAGAFTSDAFETVGVEQRHEQLELVLFAAVGGSGHQQQVAGVLPQFLSHLIPLGLLHLAAPHGRAHLVRLIEDDQVPVHLARLVEDAFAVAGEHVQTGEPQTAA